MWAEHLDHVRPEWLDGNGHMNLAFYVLVFDRGTDAWLDLAGLGAPYRQSGLSVFAVETHTIYRQKWGRVRRCASAPAWWGPRASASTSCMR